MTLKVLIAEDARDVAEVIAFGIRMTWPDALVQIVADGKEALKYFMEQAADLVVLDVMIPPPNGFEVCQRIRETSQVPILMLTVRDSVLDKVHALDLGADDYLVKPFDHFELLARLRALVRRSSSVPVPVPEHSSSGAVWTCDDFSLNFTTREVRVKGVIIRLTSTEYRLLAELVRHAGTFLSHQFLLEQVWGPEYLGDTTYLKVFVRRLRHKLGDDAEHPRYIQTEWGTGYRFVPPR